MRTIAPPLAAVAETTFTCVPVDVGNFSFASTGTPVVVVTAVRESVMSVAAALHQMVIRASLGTRNGVAVESLVVSAPAAETMAPR